MDLIRPKKTFRPSSQLLLYSKYVFFLLKEKVMKYFVLLYLLQNYCPNYSTKTSCDRYRSDETSTLLSHMKMQHDIINQIQTLFICLFIYSNLEDFLLRRIGTHVKVHVIPKIKKLKKKKKVHVTG